MAMTFGRHSPHHLAQNTNRRWPAMTDRGLISTCFIASALAAVGVSAIHTSMEKRLRALATPAQEGQLIGNRTAPYSPDNGALPASGQELYLIRTALTMLDHANQTGNYSVLRDSAAPIFRKSNSTSDLHRTFSRLRRKRFALAPAIANVPYLIRPSRVAPNGRLNMTGFINHQNEFIAFNLDYMSVNGHWKLVGLQVGLKPADQVGNRV